MCDDADASECSQETSVTSKGAGRNLDGAAVPSLSARHWSKHLQPPTQTRLALQRGMTVVKPSRGGVGCEVPVPGWNMSMLVCGGRGRGRR